MTSPAEAVTDTVVVTLVKMAEQLTCAEDRRTLSDVAEQIGRDRTDWTGSTCPVCQEEICDEDCPLKAVRDEAHRGGLAT